MGVEMENTTLVIMAAGIGSRFGKGIKQLTPVGPSGELIMDYSVHDAIEAGFNKIVFIIRKDIKDEFDRLIGQRIAQVADIDYVFQELDDLPEGFTCPPDRTKPWGTGQAVLCCKGVVKGKFAVVNADDYYGKEPYVLLHDFLTKESSSDDPRMQICAAGFRLGNTLSENGGVTRGVCKVAEDGSLVGIDETKNIIKTEDGAAVLKEDGTKTPLDPENMVSMNMWGFPENFIDVLEKGFKEFLERLEPGDIKTEYLLPIYIDELLKADKAKISVLPTNETWFGVTYQEDKDSVIEAFKKLVEEGKYKRDLYA